MNDNIIIIVIKNNDNNNSNMIPIEQNRINKMGEIKIYIYKHNKLLIYSLKNIYIYDYYN